jgi:hypothetical protein
MPPVYKYIVVWKDLEENKIYRTKISFERRWIEILFNSLMSDKRILYLFKIKYNGALRNH